MKNQITILGTLLFIIGTLNISQAQQTANLSNILQSPIDIEFSLSDSIQQIKQEQLMKRLYNTELEEDTIVNDQQSMMFEDSSYEELNIPQQNLYNETNSKKGKGFALGAVIGGTLGMIIGVKIGSASAKKDGLGVIVSGPLKVGLGLGLGSLIGVTVGGGIGMSMGSKVKVPIQQDLGSIKMQQHIIDSNQTIAF